MSFPRLRQLVARIARAEGQFLTAHRAERAASLQELAALFPAFDGFVRFPEDFR